MRRIFANASHRRVALALAALLVLATLGVNPWTARAVWTGSTTSALASGPAQTQAVYLPLTLTVSRPVAAGLPFDPYASRSGQATFYGADGGGNCTFAPSPGNLMVGAMNHVDYAASLICGAYVEVTGPKGTITVRITDQCPECPSGNIDLSAEAFAKIADPVQGRVPITWHIVSPALAGPIVYHFKDGSSQWWTAVQIRNHRNGIWRVEYRTASTGWKTLPRVDYNYFIDTSGMGPGPYSFRVTDYYGNVLTDSGIPLVVNGDVAGKAQFPQQP